jgi:SAM-dependent methyltransferase
MGIYKLSQTAREFVLFQRTGLLPQRPVSLISRIIHKVPRFIGRIIRKIDSRYYTKWVKSIAADNNYDVETRYFSDMEKVANRIALHLPPQAKSILDIGCGIAALDIFLDKLTSPENIFLLDKTQIEDGVWYSFYDKGAFYNSLEIAKQTLILNGVNASTVKLISAPNDGVIPLEPDSIDVIVSTISWGFHYPIKLYIESVNKLLRRDGVLIVDIRKNTDGFNELAKFFEVIVIHESTKFKTVKCAKRTKKL